jgi:spermidine synthase
MASFAISIFLSAFLLFGIQPLVGKLLLPRFGGTPSVWAVCILFFQLVLVLGYGYSYYLSRSLNSKQQGKTHLGLLALSFLWLMVQHSDVQAANWPEVSGYLETPALTVLWLLASRIGLPFFVLASTGPLLQSWLSFVHPATSPYRLYALSNLASLLALIGYPFVVEPLFTLKTQAALWALGYCTCLCLTGTCAIRSLKAQSLLGRTCSYLPTGAAPATPGLAVRVVLWICLAACASGMMLATTNQLCQEVAAIPFLWIVPLSVYLVSFILCFECERTYSRNLFAPALAVCVGASCLILDKGLETTIPAQLLAYSLTLFVCCMVCHGELARMKPATCDLTTFYLAIAIGGALGGAIVSLVAPWVFLGFWEFPLFLWLSCLLALALLARDRNALLSTGGSVSVLSLVAVSLGLASLKFAKLYPDTLVASLRDFVFTEWTILLWLGCVIGFGLVGVCRFVLRRISLPAKARLALTSSGLVFALAMMASLLAFQAEEEMNGAVLVSRSFFGSLVVTEEDAGSSSHKYKLRHGRTVHGYQFQESSMKRWPTSYFGQDSGIGMALLHHPRRARGQGLRIGVLGLGVGTIAAYGLKGDTLRFYEINPEVVELSQKHPAQFTYLAECPGTVDVILGDGRLSLERELRSNQPQQFDVLAIDAFSSDAVPVHLLTKEAGSIYLRHLRLPDGILAFQVTNRYLNLKPVVIELAKHFGLYYRVIERVDGGELAWENTWVLLSANDRWLTLSNSLAQETEVASVPLWTDDYSNLFQCLKQ